MLTLGITGHRNIQRPYWGIHSSLGAAITQLSSQVTVDTFCLLSALAEGADTLAVDYLLRRFDCRLVVPLPLPVQDYERDFSNPASLRRFRYFISMAEHTFVLSKGGTRPEVYEQVGKYLVNHCDLLMAFWDGQPEQGRGGTASVVMLARQAQKPMCWIHTSRRGRRLQLRPAFTFENLDRLIG